jgi:hypothetical protein
MNRRHFHLGKSLLERVGEHRGGRLLDIVETHGQMIAEAGPDNVQFSGSGAALGTHELPGPAACAGWRMVCNRSLRLLAMTFCQKEPTVQGGGTWFASPSRGGKTPDGAAARQPTMKTLHRGDRHHEFLDDRRFDRGRHFRPAGLRRRSAQRTRGGLDIGGHLAYRCVGIHRLRQMAVALTARHRRLPAGCGRPLSTCFTAAHVASR